MEDVPCGVVEIDRDTAVRRTFSICLFFSLCVLFLFPLISLFYKMGRPRSERRKRANKTKSRNLVSSPAETVQGFSFSGSLKAMNKLLKAFHHVGYLSALKPGQLPPAIEDERKKLTRFWKPASITSDFRDQVLIFGKQYFDSVIKLLIDQ